MAITRIADVIVPTKFAAYVQEQTAEKSALFTSGIIGRDPRYDDLAVGGGRTLNLPFWHDLTGTDEVASDSVALTPAKIDAGQDIAVLLRREKAWAANDLAGDLAGDDPMAAIGNRVATWWSRRFQAALLSTLKGIFADALNPELVSDISALTGGAELFSAETLIDATQKLGDAKDQLAAIVLHSAVEAHLAKQDLIDVIRDSQGEILKRTYMGLDVIVDDGMPVASGTYTTYIFSRGSVAFGEGTPDTPVETDRDALAGDDYLVNRRNLFLHPRGVAFQSASVTGSSPSNVELETAANWLRVYEVKNIGIVQFLHKIG
jgi:hypothetical protein